MNREMRIKDVAEQELGAGVDDDDAHVNYTRDR